MRQGQIVSTLVAAALIGRGSQLAGLAGLAIDLGACVMLRYAIGHE